MAPARHALWLPAPHGRSISVRLLAKLEHDRLSVMTLDGICVKSIRSITRVVTRLDLQKTLETAMND